MTDIVDEENSLQEKKAGETAFTQEQSEGIQLEYALRFEEVYESLKQTAYPKNRKIRMWVEAGILLALFVGFLISYFVTGDKNSVFFAAVSITLFFSVAVIPFIGMRMDANGIANGHIISMQVFPSKIIMGRGAGQWKIPLDGSCKSAVFGSVLVIYFDKKNMVVLPFRCIKEKLLPQVQSMIQTGTRPREA